MKFLGPTAKAAGISIEEAAAAVGALGNAGIQGTMAGTGLRMAINKLLAPSEDARKTMARLGFNFLTMTSAGEKARAVFFSLQAGIESLKKEVDTTTNSMRILNDEMTDMSIQEQRNTLAIAQIRRKASKGNRDLTNREMKQIEKLENANQDLALTQQKGALEQAILTQKQDRASHSLSEMNSTSKEANDIMNQQVMGITSLSDVITQLGDSGASTAEILDIFSTRGGTAVQALLAQKEGFLGLVDATQNADGALEKHLGILETSTARKLAIVRSEFEETKLVIGEAFLDALDMEAFASAMKGISVSIAENSDKFAEWGTVINESFLPAMGSLSDQMSNIASISKDLAPLLKVFSGFLQIVLALVVGVSKLLRLLTQVGEGVGKATGATKGASSAAGAATSGMAAGAAIGFMAGGPIGAGIGALVGGASGIIGETGVPFMAEGGVVTKPTLAVVGEAGPEAVIPLDRFGGGDSAGTNINFGGVTIYGNPQMDVSDFKNMMKETLPTLFKQTITGGNIF